MTEIAIITTASASNYPPLVIPLDPDSDTDTIPERVVRTPTLDGGAVIYSLGKSDGDRTFTLIGSMSREELLTLDNMRSSYSDFCLSVPDGVYRGMISDVSADEKVTITFLAESKL